MGRELKSWLGLSHWLLIRGQAQLVHAFSLSRLSLSLSLFFGLNHRVMLKVEQLSWDPTVTRRRMDSWKCRRSLAPGGAGLHFPDFLLFLLDAPTVRGFFPVAPGDAVLANVKVDSRAQTLGFRPRLHARC